MIALPWRRRRGVLVARLLRSRAGGSPAPGGALSIVAHAGAIVLVVTGAGRASPGELRPVSVGRDTVAYVVVASAADADASGGREAAGERLPRTPRAIADRFRSGCRIEFHRDRFPDWRSGIRGDPPPPADSILARQRSAAPHAVVPASRPPSPDEPFTVGLLDCWSQVLARPSHLHYTEDQP